MNGSAQNFPCTGWTNTFGCGTPTFNFCGAFAASSPTVINSISLANASACQSDINCNDYFTANVTVDFYFAASSGNLTLKQGTTVVATKTASELSCVTSWTFNNVQMIPNGLPLVLTAEFDSGVTFTAANLGNAPAACRTANVIYVKPVASGNASGTSWTNATNNLQNALNTACGNFTEVWVAAGTYKPSQDPSGNATPTDPRNKTFYLKNGVKVYGGFAGTEGSLSQRVLGTNETILSGDLNGNDVGFTNNGENTYHVVLSVSDDATTVLDRFTIVGGNANGTASLTVETKPIAQNSGGGVPIIASSASINAVVFKNNNAVVGGGLFTTAAATSPNVTNSVFSNNTALYGGAVFNGAAATSNFANCIFSNNTASVLGAGFYNQNTTTVITNCTFGSNNIYNETSTMTLTNAIMWGSGSGIRTSGVNTVTYSIVQGGFTGTGNSASDPLFVNAANPIGADGVWMTADDGLQLACGSAAYNTGTASGAPATDILGIRDRKSVV